ncbi:MAG: chromosomal replication initiator protein DnaA [Ignavibacteriales bacterium]|nr:chromosomal replication initiator protein DnaA [Ignavibacteriales bacterium]
MQNANPAINIWVQALSLIKSRVNTQTYKSWFEPIVPVDLDTNKITLQVPSQFFVDWLEEHYYSLINEVLTQISNRELFVIYAIVPEDPDLNRPQAEVINDTTHVNNLLHNLSKSPSTSAQSSVKQFVNPSLNTRYTFDKYIKGESNQFARAAALAVANNPGGTSFNPLVIYGGVGLGKTHLVQAIGNHVLLSGKSSKVLYVSSEKFTVDFVEAIQKDNISSFSNYYRNIDLLIVDDIQFFAGKEKTQDIFFHTFNALHQLGKQIVLSSDRPPKDLQGLNDRLTSRFQWGLTADIQSPDLETRIAILQKKSSDTGVELSQDVVEFIANNITSNIRELEGCLISLLARASLENCAINLDLAYNVVRTLVGEVRSHITIEEIQRVVANHFGIPDDLLRAKTRKQEVVNARQIAMYLAKELTNSSLKTIGLHFGGRDHSTVIHAYQTVEDSTHLDNKQKSVVQHLRNTIEHGIRR